MGHFNNQTLVHPKHQKIKRKEDGHLDPGLKKAQKVTGLNLLFSRYAVADINVTGQTFIQKKNLPGF